MASNLKMANTAVNAEADALAALCNNGKLQIYDGAQPVNADTDVGAQLKLVEFSLPNPAFASAVAGLLVGETITSVNALQTGTATWFRIVSSGDVKLWDGSVAVLDADLILNSVNIGAGAAVSVTGVTHQVTK